MQALRIRSAWELLESSAQGFIQLIVNVNCIIICGGSGLLILWFKIEEPERNHKSYASEI